MYKLCVFRKTCDSVYFLPSCSARAEGLVDDSWNSIISLSVSWEGRGVWRGEGWPPLKTSALIWSWVGRVCFKARRRGSSSKGVLKDTSWSNSFCNLGDGDWVHLTKNPLKWLTRTASWEIWERYRLVWCSRKRSSWRTVSSFHFRVGHFRTLHGLLHAHGGEGGEQPFYCAHLRTQVVVAGKSVSSTQENCCNIFSRSSSRTGSSWSPCWCSRYLGMRRVTHCRDQKGPSFFP